MVAPRALGILLLLHLASGEEDSTPKYEEPRNVCQGFTNMNSYEDFDLNRTAGCFSKCTRSQEKLCHLGNLQRYWLNFETYLVERNQMDTLNTSFLTAFVKSINTNVSEDLYFSLTPSQIPKQVTKDEHQHPDRVRLPKSLFGSLKSSGPMVRLGIIVLDIGPGNVFKGSLLSREDGSRVLNNRIVGLTLGHINVTELAEPLEITFSHQYQPPNMNLSCEFWDATKGDWSSKGCSTEVGVRRTVCRCDHLTFFALLLVIVPPPRPSQQFQKCRGSWAREQGGCGQGPGLWGVRAWPPVDRILIRGNHPQRPILDEATVRALIHISQAGCGTSMIFLAFTIVLYVVLRFSRQRFKSEDAPKIHVALSISLFLLNLAFFLNVGQRLKGSNAACWARGAVFHYFLLCAFTWMGLEAFHLYLLVIKVFNTYFSHYFLKLSLMGWVLPALIVIGTGIANSYGPYCIRDEKNVITLELCWFREKTALYVTVYGYCLIIFLFSAVILSLVSWKIFTLSSATAGKEKGQHWKGVLTLLGLSCLVGLPWGLALLTSLGQFTAYVFALFTSLQGVFIFCWFIVLYCPSQSTVTSSSGTARVDHAQTVSHE
ncbi:adhesion G protein-coupled receptor G3 isoform X1 [Bos taurus]|uniref:adhesion G protein-coupled receptor G3 isoform X1 n=1 Tax=Bos taurus TaxID=9913 RepID=UPI00076047A1|nr:adhesion G protein-coupled receptor G3 isoform X1 [Bos taurus]